MTAQERLELVEFRKEVLTLLADIDKKIDGHSDRITNIETQKKIDDAIALERARQLALVTANDGERRSSLKWRLQTMGDWSIRIIGLGFVAAELLRNRF